MGLLYADVGELSCSLRGSLFTDFVAGGLRVASFCQECRFAYCVRCPRHGEIRLQSVPSI